MEAKWGYKPRKGVNREEIKQNNERNGMEKKICKNLYKEPIMHTTLYTTTYKHFSSLHNKIQQSVIPQTKQKKQAKKFTKTKKQKSGSQTRPKPIL